MIKELDVHKNAFSKSIHKYMYRQQFETDKGIKKFEFSYIFITQYLKYVWRNVSLFFGILLYLLANSFFVMSCLNDRKLSILKELQKSDYKEIDFFVMTMVLTNIIAIFSMFTILLSDPGYIKKKNISDSDNALAKLSG
jgi:hypothetical protein